MVKDKAGLTVSEETEEDLTDGQAFPGDTAMRPLSFSDFAGQERVIASLRISIDAAKARGEPVDHILFSGGPGLGKTTLANIIANEMNYSFAPVFAPSIAKPGDLVSILMEMQDHTVLFIDEIHRLNNVAAEILYTAMEDRKIHISIGKGETVTLDIVPFTLIGATTRTGLLTTPLLDRFGLHLRLEYYSVDELTRIVARDAGAFAMAGSEGAWREISVRSRGTPRIAKRLLRRVRDVVHAEGLDVVDPSFVGGALKRFGVDDIGLNGLDRRYLEIIARSFRGGPVGIESLSAALSENRDILENSVEPYLLTCGLIDRTARGREITIDGLKAIGLPSPRATRKAPALTSALSASA